LSRLGAHPRLLLFPYTTLFRSPPETGHPRWALADATELWWHETRLHATRTAFRGQTQEVEMADALTMTRYEHGLKKMSEVYGVEIGRAPSELQSPDHLVCRLLL